LTTDGEKFRDECKKDDKAVMAWRVDSREEMMEATRLGIKVILTDHTRRWMDLKEELIRDYATTEASISRSFIWRDWKTYSLAHRMFIRIQNVFLRKIAGPFHPADKPKFDPFDWVFLRLLGIIGWLMRRGQ